MAITILEQPQGTILNAYNNSIIRYGLEVGDVLARSVIRINGISYITYPNGQEFYFDAKPIVTLLINQMKFQDSIVPASAAVILVNDPALSLDLQIEIDVFTTNGVLFQDSLTLSYIKGVVQVFKKRYTESNELRILSPTTTLDRYMTYFEGYPFDLSVYSNIARTIRITNQNNGLFKDVAFAKGVSRLFISNGENDNLGFENDVPLILGTNHLTFTYAGTTHNVFIEKKPVECGTMIKWFNRSGGWSYWLFNGYEADQQNSSTTGAINNDFSNIENTNSLRIITGKSGSVSRSVDTGIIEGYESLILSELFTSPKVYFYDQVELQPFTLNDWKEIEVADRTYTINRSKQPKNRYQVDLQFPNLLTQSYAG